MGHEMVKPTKAVVSQAPKKPRTNRAELVRKIDEKAVEKLLKDFEVPERNRPMAIERLEDRPGVVRQPADDVVVDLHEITEAARGEIAMIKVLAPNVAHDVIDWAIQAHGAGGVSSDFPLAYAYAHQRTLRLADGPDEVHRNAIAKLELARHIASATQEVEMPVTRGS